MTKARGGSGIEISSLTSSSAVRTDWCARRAISEQSDIVVDLHERDSFSHDGSNYLDQLGQMAIQRVLELFIEIRIQDVKVNFCICPRLREFPGHARFWRAF